MIGNIEPRLRSGLHTIQLLAVTRTEHIYKYGINKILKPFIEDINRLETVNVLGKIYNTFLRVVIIILQGVTFNTPHGPHQFEGSIAAMAADNLGSHLLGGFKAPSRSLRCCRQCMATSESLKLKVNSNIIACDAVK